MWGVRCITLLTTITLNLFLQQSRRLVMLLNVFMIGKSFGLYSQLHRQLKDRIVFVENVISVKNLSELVSMDGVNGLLLIWVVGDE